MISLVFRKTNVFDISPNLNTLRFSLSASISLISFPLANTRVSRHLNTVVFSALKCRMLFLLVMHSRAPLEKTTSSHLFAYLLNIPSSIFPHASCCILEALAEPCFCMCLHCLLSLIFVDLLTNCLNIVLLIIEVIPVVWTTVNKVSIYSILSFHIVFAHSFTLPVFLNYSKSSMKSVLQCSFLHPFLALLILLCASTLRQVHCDHRRK